MGFQRSFRQSRLTSLGRRVRYLGSRLLGSRLQKSQTVAVVEINGQRYKRVILRDSFLATAIEHALEDFGPSPHLPGLVIRYEHEIWVEFVDGEVPAAPGHALARDLAHFYAHLYTRNPREIDSTGDIWLGRLDRDLRFLAQVGVLSASAYAAIERAIPSLAPARYWLGYDYNDPVVKNFVIANDGVLCGVDVEALVPDQLLGLGVAKALMRWMEPYRATFFEALADTDAPDFAAYFDFVELHHLAAYTKLMFVERKWANVLPERFERFYQ